MSHVTVESETEDPRGWRYAVRVTQPNGRVSDHTVTLAWVDHDHWSGGRLAPSRVVEAVVEYLVERGHAGALPPAFDAARARRMAPAIDREIRAAL